jgi:hypothetical protein
MEHHEQQILVVGDMHDADAKERVGPEVEGPPGELREQRHRLLLVELAGRTRADVPDVKLDGGVVGDLRDRLAVPQPDSRAEDLVA